MIFDRPKGLAPIGEKPFLDILIENLLQEGFQRIIFCVGYMKEQIIERYSSRDDAQYLFAQENTPLGTGGAIKNALPMIHSNPFLIMNGDSLCHIDFEKFLQFHRDKAAAASFAVTRVSERPDGDVVLLTEEQRILCFTKEYKANNSHGCFVNAGIYMMQQESLAFKNLAPPFSLELDVFPRLVNSKPCFGFLTDGPLLDIGTPERYQKANGL
jgi:NDP-sugar pyrophosphorylase family protein